jgi:DNA helicase-2/ATP-dependent DNA helicase PcrA
MICLSQDQLLIVNAPIGKAIQVLASAGSGKTRVLTERIRFIISCARKDGVIAFTFTNKAAEEMRLRLDDVDEIDERGWIGTIHAIAQRILEQYGHTIGLPSELHIYERDQDRKTVFLKSLRESGIDIDSFLNVRDEKTKKDRERTIQKYMEQFSAIKRELLTEKEVKEKYSSDDNFWKIFIAYQEALLESNGIDFDDILVYAHKILLEQPWCGQVYRAKYKHICVDEAQDLNNAQYEFIKALCGDAIKSLMMVGDPNQMIYGFNGSSQSYLCNRFVSDFQPIKYELKQNYRSSKAVINLANKLKPGSQVESLYALNGRSQIEIQEDEKCEALWISNKIIELINTKNHPDIEGEISLNKMVVIARTRFVFKSLEACLEEKNIPYLLKKGESQFEPLSTFGKILDLAVRTRLNPKDWVNAKKLSAVMQVDRSLDQSGDIDLLQQMADDVRGTNIPFPSIQSELLIAIKQLNIEQPNIPKLCERFKEEFEKLDAIKLNADDREIENTLQEIKDFRDCWTLFKRKGLGDSLSSFRNAMALGQLSKDYSSDGLILSTVHTMKGLEKDIVFLMGMCQGVFPDYRARSLKEIDEERNNAFVAITRSRRWIYVTYPRKREMPWGDTKVQEVSQFVKEISQ